jgi:hypothetical protein
MSLGRLRSNCENRNAIVEEEEGGGGGGGGGGEEEEELPSNVYIK